MVLVSAVVAACVLAWIGLATLVVPALIESAYRGESLPAINAIIEGRGAFPVDHYLQLWNTFAWQFTGYVLVYLSVGVLIATAASRPGFFRKYVGEATPGTLGAIRMLTCTALLVVTSWEDLASVALLPPEMRHGAGMMRAVLALPGFDRLVASGMALGTLQTATELLLFMGAIGCFTRIVIPLSGRRSLRAPGHSDRLQLFLAPEPRSPLPPRRVVLHALRRRVVGRQIVETVAGPRCSGRTSRRLRLVAIPLLGRDRAAVCRIGAQQATDRRVVVVERNEHAGHALRRQSVTERYDWNLSPYLVSAPDGLFTFLGVTTVILEVFFFLVLFSRRARWVLPILMLMVHAGIFGLQRILFFDLMLLQLAFIDFAGLREATSRRAAAGRRPIEVLYDGSCSVCRRTVGILGAVDLFTVLRFCDITRLDLADWRDHTGFEFDRPQLERSMHVVSRDRRVLRFRGLPCDREGPPGVLASGAVAVPAGRTAAGNRCLQSNRPDTAYLRRDLPDRASRPNRVRPAQPTNRRRNPVSADGIRPGRHVNRVLDSSGRVLPSHRLAPVRDARYIGYGELSQGTRTAGVGYHFPGTSGGWDRRAGPRRPIHSDAG